MREDLFAIWNAGIRAVLCEPLIRRAVVLNETTLRVGQKTFPPDSIDRIVVIGGGKASGYVCRIYGTYFRNYIVIWENMIAKNKI
ncbi:MAG: hypothetical protein LBH00_12175 [Planctomycetaceae bacterium]|nr:hypothetical protein [Planctomycetaceae bacterium]